MVRLGWVKLICPSPAGSSVWARGHRKEHGLVIRVAKVEDNLIIWVYGLILMGCLLFLRFKKILKVEY